MWSNDTKAIIYAPLLSFSTEDNTKLLKTINWEKYENNYGKKYEKSNWEKYEPKVSTEAPIPYLDFLINPSFRGINRLFVLSFKNKDNRTAQTKFSNCRNKGL